MLGRVLGPGSVFAGFTGGAFVVAIAGPGEAFLVGVASAEAFWVAGAGLAFFLTGLNFSSFIGLDGAGLVFAAVAFTKEERLWDASSSGVALD